MMSCWPHDHYCDRPLSLPPSLPPTHRTFLILNRGSCPTLLYVVIIMLIGAGVTTMRSTSGEIGLWPLPGNAA